MAGTHEAPSTPRLHLALIGGVDGDCGGASVKLPNAKANAILAYLALHERRSATREQLAGLLWSERSEDRARASLRQCVKQLNRLFDDIGFSGFSADRSYLSLHADTVITDVQDVLARLETGTLVERDNRAGLDPRDLLRGYEDLDPMFWSWLRVKRQSLHDEMVRCLEAVLDDRGKSQDIVACAAERLIEIDATHEQAYRTLIRLHAERGNTAAAVRLYDQLWQVLDEEHDVEPSPETQELIVAIKSGAAPAPRHPDSGQAAGPEPRIPVIGVTPFVPTGPVTATRDVIEGVRRELIAGLVRFREWVVVESGPAAGHGTGPGAEAEPGVDYLLEGSYLERGEGCRLVVTLKDWRTRRYIWSEQYDLDLANWPAAQQTIARRMAIAMNLSFSASRIAPRTPKPDGFAQIYDLWLRGQSLIGQWEPAARAQAESCFREIIRREPGFAPAHCGLATIYNSRHIVEPGAPKPPDAEKIAAEHATIAVTLDPLDTRSQLAFAWSNAMRGRFEQAELHYGLSLDLNPNNPHTLMSAAQGLAFCADYRAARRHARQAMELNPTGQGYMLVYAACISFLAGDYGDCVRLVERSGGAILTASGFKTAALAHLGRGGEAAAEGRRFVEAVRAKWLGDRPATDEAITAWFLGNFPIRDAAAFAQLDSGLRAAGLPVE